MGKTIPPTGLKNELSSSFEFGTEVRLFDNRVMVDFTYYDSKTTNQILNLEISDATAYNNMTVNAGEISNKGIEILASLVPLRNPKSLNWSVDLNFARNRSMVVELAEGIDVYSLLNSNVRIEARPGEAYGNISGFSYLRNDAGEKVVHQSGNFYRRTTDRQILGNIQPDWLGGVTNTFSYKGFQLSALIDVRFGGEIYSWSKDNQIQKGTGKFTENRDNLIVEGVIENADGTYTPTSKVVLAQNYYAQLAWNQIREEFVLDATYASLREVLLSYDFNKSILSRTPIRSAKLSLVARNLFYLYRDPEFKEMGVTPESAFAPTAAAQGFESYSMPSTRSIGFNLSLAF
jgi:hypothetical protein